jgi:hypothetical protein
MFTESTLLGVAGVRKVFVEGKGEVIVTRSFRNSKCAMPLYFLNGMRLPYNSMDSQNRVLSILPSDLYGIEIYQSAAELPVEYNTMDAACGVIAVWTTPPP